MSVLFGKKPSWFFWVGLSEPLVLLFFTLGLAGLDDGKDFNDERRCFFGATSLPEGFKIPVEDPLFLEDFFHYSW